MGVSDDFIINLYEDQKKQRAPWAQAAQQIQSVAEGSIRLPLPEVDKVDVPAVANLTLMGIDAYGQRISSTMPMPTFDIMTLTNIGRERARQRQDLVGYWWDDNQLELGLGTIGRHFVAYGATTMIVKPQRRKKRPEFVVLDPIDTFPVGDEIACEAGIHVHRKTRRWVNDRYSTANKLLSRNPKPNDEIELLEYVDDQEWVILGRLIAASYEEANMANNGVVRLATIPNLAGMCPMTAIGRPGLTRPMSQFSASLGMYVQRAMLQAYDLIGLRMSVMPQTWVVGRPNESPVIEQIPDAINGIPGIITGGQVEQLYPQPTQQLPQSVDRLEAGERMQSGVMAEMQGVGASNVRTGKRGDQIMSATVDFPVQEAQKWIARMLRDLDVAAIHTDKGYWGGTSKSFYVSRQGSEEKVTYDPAKLWVDADGETITRHEVSYAHAGADVNNLVVGVGQSIGIELMSKQTGRRIHPMIEDPEGEHDQIIFEKLEMIGLNVLEQQAAQGALQWSDLVGIMAQVRMDKEELIPALVKQQAAAQARQAAQQAQQAQQAPPIGPEGQPGMGAGPPGAPGGQPEIGPPPQALGNLGMMLQDLRLPNSRSAPQLTAPQGG
jgi:hypothetical protein